MHKNDDLISRQAAIEALARVARKMFTLSDEFNHYLAGLMDGENAIRQLPSVQPEIVRCKDCKWKQGSECVRFADVRPFPDDFCSRAERREA